MAIGKSFESAAGFEGVELAMVADDDCLGASNVDRGEQLEHRSVVGHACLVDDEHSALVQSE